ncbi:hypothetical protein NHQ30_008273 [Ciborinia camelliae]|nr:hypothetical protein NHQ30_008273 [Ciborinia camelliae]
MMSTSQSNGDNLDEQSSREETNPKRYLSGFRLILAVVGLLGLKPALLGSGILFIAFSAGCGASRSINELIIFRALQGLGGAGLYSLPSIAFFQLVPPEQYNRINTVSSSIMAIALIVSPLIGGAISQTGDWRWIFYLNLPAGAVSLALIAFVLPARFPDHCDATPQEKPAIWSSNAVFIRKADLFGAFLILGASILLVAGLEEGGVSLAWNSATIILIFIISGCLWILFVLWQWYGGRATSKVEVMYPRRLVKNRVLSVAIFACFVSGAPMTIAAIELPQRYQLVNKSSSLGAGVKLLAYAVPMPVGILVGSVLTGKKRIPFVYTLLLGATLQTIGFALMSTVPIAQNVWPGQYGYSVIAGLGVGISVGTYYVLTPIACDKQDQHLALGLGLQARMLGGAVGLAIVNSVWLNYVRSHLTSVLSGRQIALLLRDFNTLSLYTASDQSFIRSVCGDGYNLQMRATLGFTIAQFFIVLALWRKRPLRLGTEGTLVSG